MIKCRTKSRKDFVLKEPVPMPKRTSISFRKLLESFGSDRELVRRRITMLLAPNPAVVFFGRFVQLEMAVGGK